LPGSLTGSALEARAREFAADLSNLLNRTVTRGLRFSTVLREPSLCVLAPGIAKRDLKPELIELSVGKKATGYLLVACVLELDHEETFLTVNQSQVGLYASNSLKDMVFHYDYNREPANEYPNPHFQVAGQSDTLAAVIAASPSPSKSLRDMHFPVGGRRFRPTIEDVIEFLVIERLADPHPGWEAAVEQRREIWRESQLKAAVRRYPEWACESLRRIGYDVTPPSEEATTR
jgi:hypothetical protein